MNSSIERVFVDCFVMRHGEPELKPDGSGHRVDKLTPRGYLQAAAASSAHLSHVQFDAAYASGMVRAEETIRHALSLIGQAHIPIQAEKGFGFTWLDEIPGLPKSDFYAVERMLIDQNGSTRGTMVAEWLKPGLYPPMWSMIGSMTSTLKDVARRVVSRSVAKGDLKERYAILVGGHGPTGAAAVLEPATTPCLDFADIMRYTLEANLVDGGVYKVISSCHLACPDVA